MNTIPGKMHCPLASPFLLVHGVGHEKGHLDSSLLFVLFSPQQGQPHQTIQARSEYIGRYCGWQISYFQRPHGLKSSFQDILQAQ
jgi:hypothetical protein